VWAQKTHANKRGDGITIKARGRFYTIIARPQLERRAKRKKYNSFQD
jgi:hypothetical protein